MGDEKRDVEAAVKNRRAATITASASAWQRRAHAVAGDCGGGIVALGSRNNARATLRPK
jgi:hypothetical protein